MVLQVSLIETLVKYFVPAHAALFAGKIRLEDMLSALPSNHLASLRKALKPLTAKAGPHDEGAVRNPIKRPGPLPAPLPLLHQAKIDRQAANERLGQDLDDWNETSRLSM